MPGAGSERRLFASGEPLRSVHPRSRPLGPPFVRSQHSRSTRGLPGLGSPAEMHAHAELARLEREARRADEAPAALHDPRLRALALQQTAGNAAVARMLGTRGAGAAPAAGAAVPSRRRRRTRRPSRSSSRRRSGSASRRPRQPRRVALGAEHDTEAGHVPHEELPAIEAVAGEPLAATTLAAPASAPPEVTAPTASRLLTADRAPGRAGGRRAGGAAESTPADEGAGLPARTSRCATSPRSSSATRSRRGCPTRARSPRAATCRPASASPAPAR